MKISAPHPNSGHAIRIACAISVCLFVFLPVQRASARTSRTNGATWYVTTVTDDGADGNTMTNSGSLRFTLLHAQSGDFVSFAKLDRTVDIIDVYSTLTVPDGVSVGHLRSEPCGNANSPLINVRAPLSPPTFIVFVLGAHTTLRNLDIAGGSISVQAAGTDVDVCGMGLGYLHDNTDGLLPAAPFTAAFTVVGPHGWLHQSQVNNTIIVGQLASDTVIGDRLNGSGDGNTGDCGNMGKCTVSVLNDTISAARRVTIRDPFPRALLGLSGDGISGGDDVVTHTNNWVQTPSISSASSPDHFSTVQVTGVANPLSALDVYFDDHVTLARQTQTPMIADATGAFTFTGVMTNQTMSVYVVSTLNDPAHSGRVGSSSEWSAEVQVTDGASGTPTPIPTPTLGPIPTASATPSATPSPAPGTTSTPAASATPSPASSATPKPTATVLAPTATPSVIKTLKLYSYLPLVMSSKTIASSSRNLQHVTGPAKRVGTRHIKSAG